MSLCIITKFKNERHIMYEWIHHYLLEGADCIMMIDDHSNDNYLELNDWLRPLIKKGIVRILKSVSDSQIGDYNNYLPKTKSFYWVIYCDMDEFFFAVPFRCTLKKMLNTHFSKYDYIKIAWKIFTHKSKYQPKSVLKNNLTTHTNFLTFNNRSKSKGIKCIAKTKDLKYVDIHYLDFYKKNISKKKLFDWDNKMIRINHYRTQSDEYLYGVKEVRGGGVNKDKYKGFERHLDPNFDRTCTLLKRKRFNLIKKIMNRKQIRPQVYSESSFYHKNIKNKKSLKKSTSKKISSKKSPSNKSS